MKYFSLMLVTATALLCLGAARNGRRQSNTAETPIVLAHCNDARVSVFVSGWNGGFSGGTIFACRRVGTGPSEEVLVYLSGRDWCGSGGCTLLVLAPTAEGYIIVGHVKTVRLPIRVLATKTHGRNDLVAFVQGGGIMTGYDAKLTYDGKSYPPGGSYGVEIPPGSGLGTVAVSESTPKHLM